MVLKNDRWQERLATLAGEYHVPGAALGVLCADGERITAAHGVLNRATGVSVTVDSRFHLGSITKVWTATLAVRLAGAGLLDLDTPVRHYLTGLDLGSREHTDTVTMRHLLSHTSGLDGDLFDDTGRGEDYLDRYVTAILPAARPIHSPGALFSYCNSGFTLAGHVIATVAGMSWDDVLRRELLEPLALVDTVTLPEEAILGRAAVGHLGGEQEPARTWHLPRSVAPAGGITSTVDDVLSFVRAHLSNNTLAAMRDSVVRLPARHFVADSWGLGWARTTWDGRQVIGHDGRTIGQFSYLRVLPEQGVAVVLLTNGGNAFSLFVDLFTEIFREVAEVRVPRPPQPGPTTEITARWEGVYRRALQTSEVFRVDGQLRLRVSIDEDFAALAGEPAVRERTLVPLGPNDFLTSLPGTDLWNTVSFVHDSSGRTHIHENLRATPRDGGQR